MADCFSLQNVAELVEMLRTICEDCEECITCSAHDDMLQKAADAIEALMQENAKLKAERDAAVADLTKDECCLSCVHCNLNDLTCDYLDECDLGTESKWEWRGVKENEDAEE